MISLTHATLLTPDQISEVLALAQAAGDSDGAYPLSEHVVLQVRGGTGNHILVHRDDELVGYAHVDTSDPVDGPAAELVVHPMRRRRGHGHRLIDAVIEVAEKADPDGRLRLWAHGDHPSAGALAIRLGFARHRSLWQMRRSLYAPIDAPVLPDGVTLRAFEPGRDEDDWLAVNARAFAEHPEQGRWSRADLDRRMSEPWFDPAGFILAVRDPAVRDPEAQDREAQDPEAQVRDPELLGFHWTKVHDDGPEPIGEVYVLGVDPAGQGLGLASALTLAGLRYLRGRGLSQVMLYVDESNPKAVRLYDKHGFVRWSVDVGFQRVTKS